jgi:putative transposase
VNQVWADDFVHERCANGHTLTVLTISDAWTRECLASEGDSRITAARVIQVVPHLMQQPGAPRFIRRDTGPDVVAAAIKNWRAHRGVQTAYSAAGTSWQKGTNASFNRKLRDEWLNLAWFRHRSAARIGIEQGRRQDHAQRPHSRFGYRTPAQMRPQAGEV